MIFPLMLGVILGAFSVFFIAQNTGLVTVTFMNWQYTSSLSLVLILTIVCGIVITLLILLPSFIKDTFYLSHVEKKNQELVSELTTTKDELSSTKHVMSQMPQRVQIVQPVE